MDTKKRIIRSLTVLAIIFSIISFSACGNSTSDKDNSQKNVQKETEQETKDQNTASKKSNQSSETNESSNSSSSSSSSSSNSSSNENKHSKIRITSPAQASNWVKRKIGGGDANGPYVYSYMSNTVEFNGHSYYWVKGPKEHYYVNQTGDIYYRDSTKKVADASSPDAPPVKKKAKKFILNNADEAVAALTRKYGDQGWTVSGGTMGMSNNPSWTINSSDGQIYVVYATDGHIEKQ